MTNRRAHIVLACLALLPGPAGMAAEAASPPGAVPNAPAPSTADGSASGRGRMRGEIGLSRREKLTGAVVLLLRRGDDANLFMTATDTFGIFQFDGIPEGIYSVIALRDGLHPARKDGVEVRAPFRAEVDLLMASGEEAAPVVGATGGDSPLTTPPSPIIRLTVVAQGGAPVEGARMSLRALNGAVDPVRGQSGPDGTLDFPRPPAGEYFLRIEAPGFLPLHLERTTLSTQSRNVRAFLTPRPFNYAGTPTDLLPDEKPVPPIDLRAPSVPVPSESPAPVSPATPASPASGRSALQDEKIAVRLFATQAGPACQGDRLFAREGGPGPFLL